MMARVYLCDSCSMPLERDQVWKESILFRSLDGRKNFRTIPGRDLCQSCGEKAVEQHTVTMNSGA